MFYFELVLIGISLSIDAFSLAVSLGLNMISTLDNRKYSLVVGLFHFFMPILGMLIRLIIKKMIYFPDKELFIIVLIILIFGVIVNDENNKKIINPFMFGLSVSIDSFIIGFSLNKSYILCASIIFALISSIFTYIGFYSAYKIKTKLNHKSRLISLAILIFILIYNLLK